MASWWLKNDGYSSATILHHPLGLSAPLPTEVVMINFLYQCIYNSVFQQKLVLQGSAQLIKDKEVLKKIKAGPM